MGGWGDLGVWGCGAGWSGFGRRGRIRGMRWGGCGVGLAWVGEEWEDLGGGWGFGSVEEEWDDWIGCGVALIKFLGGLAYAECTRLA